MNLAPAGDRAGGRARGACRRPARPGRLASLEAAGGPGQHHPRAAPAKAPELNPVENVWQFMRENWLSNRIFPSYSDILDHCCAAWNKLTDQPWRSKIEFSLLGLVANR